MPNVHDFKALLSVVFKNLTTYVVSLLFFRPLNCCNEATDEFVRRKTLYSAHSTLVSCMMVHFLLSCLCVGNYHRQNKGRGFGGFVLSNPRLKIRDLFRVSLSNQSTSTREYSKIVAISC